MNIQKLFLLNQYKNIAFLDNQKLSPEIAIRIDTPSYGPTCIVKLHNLYHLVKIKDLNVLTDTVSLLSFDKISTLCEFLLDQDSMITQFDSFSDLLGNYEGSYEEYYS